jgi:hypothetical protein
MPFSMSIQIKLSGLIEIILFLPNGPKHINYFIPEINELK